MCIRCHVTLDTVKFVDLWQPAAPPDWLTVDWPDMRGMVGQNRKRAGESEDGVSLTSAVPSNRRQVRSYRIRYMASWVIAPAHIGWIAAHRDFGFAKDICRVKGLWRSPAHKTLSPHLSRRSAPLFLFALPPHLRFASSISLKKRAAVFRTLSVKLRYVGLSCPRALLHFIVSAKPQ